MAGFVFYEDYYKIAKSFPDAEDETKFLEHIIERGLFGTEFPKTDNPIMDTSFIFAESLISANEKRRENGKKGGRPSKKPVVSLKENLDSKKNNNLNSKSESKISSFGNSTGVEASEEGWMGAGE